jgi:hypothetical protein
MVDKGHPGRRQAAKSSGEENFPPWQGSAKDKKAIDDSHDHSLPGFVAIRVLKPVNGE